MSALFRRRECLLPTWRGWLALLLVGALGAVVFVRGIYSWLAVQAPITGGVLVVEGWAADRALAEAVSEFRRQPYAGIYVTGIPLERGAPLSEYKTYADLSAATLIALGADAQKVHAVPTGEVMKDRTYATAVALRTRLAEQNVSLQKVNVISVGAHARRTRLLYERAFGPETQIGIIAIPPSDFEPASWWRSSQGFRVITGEIIAYAYARLLFHPDRA